MLSARVSTMSTRCCTPRQFRTPGAQAQKARHLHLPCWTRGRLPMRLPLRVLPDLAQGSGIDDLQVADVVLQAANLNHMGLLDGLKHSHAALDSVVDLFATLKTHLLGTMTSFDELTLNALHGADPQSHAQQAAHAAAAAASSHADAPTAAIVPDSLAAASQAAPTAGMAPDSLAAASQAAPPGANTAAPLHDGAGDLLANGSSDGTRDSLAAVLDAASSALQERFRQQEQQLVTGFVLNIHQVLAAVHLPWAGGVVSLQAMGESSTGLAAAVREAASSGMGLVVKVTLAALALTLAGVPQSVAAALQLGGGSAATRGGDDAAAPPAPLPEEYSAEALEQYFSKKPLLVLRRNAELLSRVSAFAVALVQDWAAGRLQERQQQRADELCRVVEELGPACIKIAQSMSTRADMLSPVYMDAFKRLQDSVKPFSTYEARAVIEAGLSVQVDDVFEWLSHEPLAAASLGQVYQAKLRPAHGGQLVAVKVQRPRALESASLDIYIMRRAALIFSMIPGMNSEWAGVLDGWAERFFQEMDYCREAHNTMRFAEHILEYNMEGIAVAKVFPSLVSRSVMVTEWVAGEKFTNCSREQVEAMCRSLLNCFLVQLLETGFLHADPHPGNLMVLPDGRVCILDFGLITEVSEAQRVLLVEYIAHLTTEDWDAVARDLEAFGFFPEGLPEDAMEVITPIVAKLMGSLVNGGGIGKSFSISMVSDLNFAARKFQMVVPGYFGLILRAFATIEGIALTVNPDFSMIQECLPYLLRRLLSDNNPRMQSALRAMLYGDAKHVDVQRLAKLATTMGLLAGGQAAGGGRGGMSSSPQAMGPTFAAAVAVTNADELVNGRRGQEDAVQAGSGLPRGGAEPLVTGRMKDTIRHLFQKDGTYAQELLADELVAAVDALSKAALGEALQMVVSSTGAKAAQQQVEALGPLRTVLFPLPLPKEIMFSMQPMVSLSSDDRELLGQLRSMLDNSVADPRGLQRKASSMVQVASELAPLVPDIMPGLQFTVERTAMLLLQRIIYRLAGEADAPQRTAGRRSAPSAAAAAAGLNAGRLPRYRSQGMVGGTGGTGPRPGPAAVQASSGAATSASSGTWGRPAAAQVSQPPPGMAAGGPAHSRQFHGNGTRREGGGAAWRSRPAATTAAATSGPAALPAPPAQRTPPAPQQQRRGTGTAVPPPPASGSAGRAASGQGGSHARPEGKDGVRVVRL